MTNELFNPAYSNITFSCSCKSIEERLLFILTRLLNELNAELITLGGVAEIFAIEINSDTGIPTFHLVLGGKVKSTDIEFLLDKWPQEFEKVFQCRQ